MWYYDEYLKSDDLTCSLYYCPDPSRYDTEPMFKGFFDAKGTSNKFHIHHDWTDRSDFIGGLISKVKGGLRTVAKEVEGLGKGVTSKVTGDAKTSSSLSNRIDLSPSGVFKVYNGTTVDIELPTFTFYLLTDTVFVSKGIVSEIKRLLGGCNMEDENILKNDEKGGYGKNNCGFGGLFQSTKTGMTLAPPSGFRSTYSYDVNHFIQGSYRIQNKKFQLNNLILTDMEVEFSDTVSAADNKTPIYAIVSLKFDFGRKQNQLDVIKMLNSTPIHNKG